VKIARNVPQGPKREQVKQGSNASYWLRRINLTSPRNSYFLEEAPSCQLLALSLCGAGALAREGGILIRASTTVCATVEERPFRAALTNEARWASAPVVALAFALGLKPVSRAA
jgi:hypothetical protein